MGKIIFCLTIIGLIAWVIKYRSFQGTKAMNAEHAIRMIVGQSPYKPPSVWYYLGYYLMVIVMIIKLVCIGILIWGEL